MGEGLGRGSQSSVIRREIVVKAIESALVRFSVVPKVPEVSEGGNCGPPEMPRPSQKMARTGTFTMFRAD